MNSQEFSFAWENADMQAGAWEHLRVVAFEGREALSELYRYELTLLARDPAPPVDPEELVGARATLRIETLSEPSTRYIHGVIVEVEEIGQTSAGPLYRVMLVPPFVRAAHRTRSRVFLEKTTRQIIDAVLLGDKQMEPAPKSGEPPAIPRVSADEFTAAVELYKWRILDPTRLDAISARPYCVQYNESDFAFVCRLLEEEGISFHVENDETTCLLVLADSDEGRARVDPFAPLGPGNLGRHINAMKLGKRLRPSKVSLVDFNWRKPALEMGVSAATPMDGGDLFVSSYPGSYPDAPSQGKPLAKSQLERFRTEARYASCETSARMLAAGSIFRLEQGAARTDGEYLVIALLVRGEASGELPPDARMMTTGVPYSAKLECARRGQGSTVMDSRFRPARVTPKPRILGSQTAMITADPWAKGVEIHVGGPEGGEIGCVRLRFPWDREVERLAREPSSCWVRVSQLFAGAGEGALWHPRVGNEVVVEFLDGDPDRPLVTGRVYNGTNRPPAAAAGSPTVSTFKSRSTPGGATFNELCFDDAAGQEHVKLHAGRDYSTAVGNDRVERIKNNSTSDVMVNRAETTGADRTVTVVGNNVETIGGDDVAAVAGDQRRGDPDLRGGDHRFRRLGRRQGRRGEGELMDPITCAARRFLDEMDAVWEAKPSGGRRARVARAVVPSEDRGELVKALRLGEASPENRRPLFLIEEPFVDADAYFATVCDGVLQDYEALRHGAAEEDVELQPLAMERGSANAFKRATVAIEQAAQKLGEHFDGIVVALVPAAVEDAARWQWSVSALIDAPLSPRVCIVVADASDGPLDGLIDGPSSPFAIDREKLAAYTRKLLAGTPKPNAVHWSAAEPHAGAAHPAIEWHRGLAIQLLDAAEQSKQGDATAATATYQQAIEACKANDHAGAESCAWIGLAAAHVTLNNAPLARRSYLMAADAAERAGLPALKELALRMTGVPAETM